MQKSTFAACIALFLSLTASLSSAASPDSDATEPAPIRKFSQATLEKLGVAIYEQDIRAAQATDLLFAWKTQKQLEKEGVRGWIVEGDAPNMTVLFIKQGAIGLEAAYSITFSGKQKPAIEIPKSLALTDRQRALYAARTLALNNIKRPCSRAYNLVMLPDPENNKNILVYALAATTKADEVMVGGHYRFTISPDGKRIEQIDALSRSCLTMSKRQGIPDGAKLTALNVNTLIDDKPQETHVYLSLLHKIPIYVATPQHALWYVSDGKMSNIDPNFLRQ